MQWLKRTQWKVGIFIVSILLLLLLLAWIPVAAVESHETIQPGQVRGVATGTITVQATPTEDATVTALNKEKLAQEVQQLKNQNAPDLFSWLRTNAAILLSTLVVVIGGLIGLFRWFRDRRSEREKQAEVRFQAAVTGLGDEKQGARIGAAILLRTFLRPGYEQFYTQTFDLAVANLCPTETPHPPEDPQTPLTLTTLRQALIVVFKEAFPLVRSQNKGSPQSLDASYIQLDNAYLRGADLKQAWMPEASLRGASLSGADLSKANLREVKLSKADLHGASLSGADLSEADLHGAKLNAVSLSGAKLLRASLSKADLSGANLHGATLRGVNLSRASLGGADLSEAELSETNFENALSLDRTNLHGVKGLTKEQLATCKAKGAIIDEAPTTSPPQSTVSPSPP